MWAVLVTAAAMAAAGAVVMSTPSAQAADSAFYVDPQTNAAKWVAATRTTARTPVIRDRIAAVPQGRWFATYDPSTVRSQVDAYVGAAAAAGKIPIMAVYAMPNRDCGGPSAGGAPDHTAYRAWIVRDRGRVWRAAPPPSVLEPDALGDHDQLHERLGAGPGEGLHRPTAGKRFKQASSQAKVYFDIGHDGWLSRLGGRLQAGRRDVANSADGLAVNTSNYRATPGLVLVREEHHRGDRRVPAEGGHRHQPQRQRPVRQRVVRPGGPRHGPLEAPRRRADPAIDAYLWVKPPGEADGCIASAGQFVSAARVRPGRRGGRHLTPTVTPTIDPDDRARGLYTATYTGDEPVVGWLPGRGAPSRTPARRRPVPGGSAGRCRAARRSRSSGTAPCPAPAAPSASRNLNWNGTLAAGASTTFGFLVNGQSGTPSTVTCTSS
ncbi:glycoside hydrolase family 6 protein [Nonomuraea rubra]